MARRPAAIRRNGRPSLGLLKAGVAFLNQDDAPPPTPPATSPRFLRSGGSSRFLRSSGSGYLLRSGS